MANFKTHLTVSTLAGIGYGAAAYAAFGVQPPACILAAGLCGVSGMLPDIDSGPGRPLRESLAFAAAVVSTMLVDRFQQFDLSMETIVLASAGVYLLIRFGVAELLQRFTVHRGIFHSIPAALIFGELAFLLASGDVALRWYKAGAIVLGYVSHLALDELYSIHYVRGRMALKRSFGTALKLIGRDWVPNVAIYAQLALMSFLVLNEPTWMERTAYRQRVEQATANWVDSLLKQQQRSVASDGQTTAPGAAEEFPQEPDFVPNQNPQAGSYPQNEPYPVPPRTTHAPGELMR